MALPALRLRGLYLALATFAFGEVMYSAFFDNASVIPDGTSINVGRVPLPFMHTVGDRAMLIEVAVAAALCALVGRPRAPQRVRPPAGRHERLARRLRHRRA